LIADDYEREDTEINNDIKKEDMGEGPEEHDKDRTGRYLEEDDGYEGSDTKVNSTLVAASKDKRRLSSQSDEYHHDNYDVEVDEDDINQEVCEDLSPKRFKLHHPPPPLQKRPDLPVQRHEASEKVVPIMDTRTVHGKSSVYVKQQTTFKQEGISEDEVQDDRNNEEMPWKDNGEVEVINVEPCLDMEYDYDDDEVANEEHWENSNGYSADEDETPYEDCVRKVNEGKNCII